MSQQVRLLEQEIHSLITPAKTKSGRVIIDVLISYVLIDGKELRTVVEPYCQDEVLWESSGKVNSQVAVSEWLSTTPVVGDY